MTATSGGGFALMVEGIGLAGMAELPLVVVLGMRPGPATGFPTRTEQAELLYAADCSQDEFPRLVLAPGTAEQAFYAVIRAFELAQSFQVPAILLVDQYLLDSSWTVGNLQVPAAGCRAPVVSGRTAHAYRRYEINDSGVSPFLRPGTKDQLVCSMGSEHDESGLGSEDAGNRVRMMDKRMRKLDGLRQQATGLHEFPGRGGDRVVLCFGSTFGPVREAVEMLDEDGAAVEVVHLVDVVPFPAAELKQRLDAAKRVVCVEQNSTGQLTRLLRRETGISPDETVLRFDGRPFTGEELAGRLSEACRG